MHSESAEIRSQIRTALERFNELVSTAEEQRQSPYRMTGVLGRHGERRLWRQCYGSEPATGD